MQTEEQGMPDPSYWGAVDHDRLNRPCRAFDLSMKALLNGQERDADDWAQLFKEADPRFNFTGVTQDARSRWALMEAIWMD